MTEVAVGSVDNNVIIMFRFIAISGICLGMFKGSHGGHRAAPELMCLPTMTQAGYEHITRYISLIHADALRIAP